MKKPLRIIGKVLLRIVAFIAIITLIISGMRAYNDHQYKPKDFDAEAAAKPASDLSQYNQAIEGVKVDHIQGEYMNGFHLKPENKKHKGFVITFGGSEGSPGYYAAEPLAKEGYEVLALFFFGMENQKKELVEVPLEFFQEVLDYIDGKNGETTIDQENITVLGSSKGAELGLNLASHYHQIDHLVLYAPSAWNFMGLSYTDYSNIKSSWTWQGRPVAFVNTRKGDTKAGFNLFLDFLLNRPVQYRPGYESAVKGDPNAEAARIKAEDSQADILIFAGKEDMMWQSDVSAEAIRNARPDKTEVHVFDGAGHLFLGDWYMYMGQIILAMGGSPEGNAQAAQESNQILNARLAEWHQ